jgi:7-cyano-7-deazaguanine synthase in queuosine biosynthesis
VEAWGRDFHFVIPVRDLAFWSRKDVNDSLRAFLHFLSDDTYAFTFHPLEKERALQEYIELGDAADWPFYGTDRVIMFSGGLDSLAGTVELAEQGSNLVLVSHRPVSTMSKRQKLLFQELRKTYATPMIHVPVWINKSMKYGREHTQRSRSFLYSAVGTVVAESVKARGVRFFENGIVSLNLPVAEEVLRARASRTTHPFVLDMFSQFYSLITERPFTIDNPYLFNTKTEVVAKLSGSKGAFLAGRTCSCAHAMFKSKEQWHCGTCSQCIDRRFAMLGAALEQHDPLTDYVVDVFSGPRKDGPERSMAVDYVRHGLELNRMNEDEIAAKFNLELTRAVRSLPNRSAAAQKLIEMHKRHGDVVHRVLAQQLQENVNAFLDKKLDSSSMLAIVAGQQHHEPLWKRFAQRIASLLAAGVPVACQTHKPVNENHLQEICDGILKGHDLDLVREYPFLRWSSSLTKPDWSIGFCDLWVEAKYVRKRSDIGQVTEALAADVTKYGDKVKYVLFIVYDPSHAILDEDVFTEPICSRANMAIHVLR